jgi:hypothetical protein
MTRIESFIADRRGAVVFEMPIVYALLLFTLLLPLADVAIAGFQFISAWEALRNFGQYLQYNPPADVTNLNASSWMTTVHAKAQALRVSDPQVICGDNNSSCSNPTASPKYYSYTTTVTLAPMVLRPVICNANPCTFTLPYSERFQ